MSGTTTLELPRGARSAGIARLIVTAHGAGLPSERLKSANLMVSELVSNACRHGSGRIMLTVRSDADIILLDEPLAAMGAKEGAMILDLVAKLRAEGRVSIIMIAHNYVHVLESCDRVNLIQDGEITFDKPTAETSVEELNEIVVEEYRRARTRAAG